MNNYSKISYEDAVNFLAGLNKEQLAKYYEEYNVDYPDYTELATTISDDDLVALGYEPKEQLSEFSNDNEYKTSYDDVLHFLESLDKYDIEELMLQYDTNYLEDLATAITDQELETLGFNQEDKTHNIVKYSSDYEDVLTYDDNDIEYSESLDYLEDIKDVKYSLIDPESHLYAVDNEIDYNHFKECLDHNLIDYCEPIQEDLGLDSFLFQVTPKTFEVAEDVIINDKLNPLIFDDSNKMHEDIRNKLVSYAQEFIDKTEDMNIDLQYSDIVLSGSNAGYLYTPESDIDIHIVSAEPISTEIFDQLKEEFDLFEAENPLIIEDEQGDEHQVELGIEDGYNIVMDNKNPRRYSILDDIWVDNSDQYEQYTEADISAVEGYEDVVKEYSDKIDEIVEADDYPLAIELKNELRQNRSTDLATIGALSMGNVVFKELRNNGSYGKLRNYIKSKEAAM